MERLHTSTLELHILLCRLPLSIYNVPLKRKPGDKASYILRVRQIVLANEWPSHLLILGLATNANLNTPARIVHVPNSRERRGGTGEIGKRLCRYFTEEKCKPLQNTVITPRCIFLATSLAMPHARSWLACHLPSSFCSKVYTLL